MQGLTRARLVESVRGVGGGYRFAGNPKRVTLYEVISLFEDVGALPATTGDGGGTDIAGALALVTQEIEDTAVSTLRSITLATLLNVVVPRTRRAA